MGVISKVNSGTILGGLSISENKGDQNKSSVNRLSAKRKKKKALFISAMPAIIAGIISLFSDDAFINIDSKKHSDLNEVNKTELANYDVVIYDDCYADISELIAKRKEHLNSLVDSDLKNQNKHKPYSIVYTDIHEISHLKRLINSGADGIVSKYSDPDKLREAAIKSADGEQYYCEKILNLLSGLEQYDEILSTKEKEVLVYLQEGLKNNEIANKFFLSPKTVRRHIENIIKKLHVGSLEELLILIKAKSKSN